MISPGSSRSAYSDRTEDVRFFIAGLLATVVMAGAIYLCFSYSDRVEAARGPSRLSLRGFIGFAILA
jgi:hypothetical protein